MPKGGPKLNRTNASQDVKKQDDLTKFLAELEKGIEESKGALGALKNDVNQSVVTKLGLPAQADNAMIQEYSKAFQTSIKSLKSGGEEVGMDIVKGVTVIHVDNSTNIDALELKIDPLLGFYEKEIEEGVVKLMNEQGEVKIMIALDKESNQLKQEPVIDKFTEALSKEGETLTSIDFEKTKENKNKFNFSDDIQKNNSLNSDMLVDQGNINKEAQQYIEEFMHKNGVLNTNLTAEQVYKIYEVHNMERKDGETDDTQLNIRKGIALKGFFNAEQIRVLMEGKVCGIFSDFSNSVKEKFSKKGNEQKETPANWQFKKFPKNKPVELPLKTSLKLGVKGAVLNIDASGSSPYITLSYNGKIRLITKETDSYAGIGRAINENSLGYDNTVSNNHGYIKYTDGKVFYVDTSTNGTQGYMNVNGHDDLGDAVKEKIKVKKPKNNMKDKVKVDANKFNQNKEFNSINTLISGLIVNNITSFRTVSGGIITFKKVNDSGDIVLIHNTGKKMKSVGKTGKIVLSGGKSAFIYKEEGKNKGINMSGSKAYHHSGMIMHNISKNQLQSMTKKYQDDLIEFDKINMNEANSFLKLLPTRLKKYEEKLKKATGDQIKMKKIKKDMEGLKNTEKQYREHIANFAILEKNFAFVKELHSSLTKINP